MMEALKINVESLAHKLLADLRNGVKNPATAGFNAYLIEAVTANGANVAEILSVCASDPRHGGLVCRAWVASETMKWAETDGYDCLVEVYRNA